MEIGKNIRSIRKEKGMSTLYICRKLGMEITSYRRIERNEVDVNSSRLLEIASILGVEVSYLFNYGKTKEEKTYFAPDEHVQLPPARNHKIPGVYPKDSRGGFIKVEQPEKVSTTHIPETAVSTDGRVHFTLDLQTLQDLVPALISQQKTISQQEEMNLKLLEWLNTGENPFPISMQVKPDHQKTI